LSHGAKIGIGIGAALGALAILGEAPAPTFQFPLERGLQDWLRAASCSHVASGPIDGPIVALPRVQHVSAIMSKVLAWTFGKCDCIAHTNWVLKPIVVLRSAAVPVLLLLRPQAEAQAEHAVRDGGAEAAPHPGWRSAVLPRHWLPGARRRPGHRQHCAHSTWQSMPVSIAVSLRP
jgi:hypothetical protein